MLCAASRGHNEIVKMLLQTGASPDAANRYGMRGHCRTAAVYMDR